MTLRRSTVGAAPRVAATTAAATTLATLISLAFALGVMAASPSPDILGGDPRSSGQGPGLVGDPAFALLAVLAIGLASVVATLLYLRLTAQRGR